jgi:TPR repeat protein
LRYPTFSQAAAPEAECDALAANPDDQSRPPGVSGVHYDRIDAMRAEAACRRALHEVPSPRVVYQLGRSLDAGRKYAEAVANYQNAAEQGYAAAQNSLGLMYGEGKGVVRDDTQAAAWYRKAAQQGYPVAQNNLGLMYADGRGVARDDAQAVAWYRKAAEQGYAVAENNLAFMYAEGRGVARDDAQAVAWYRKAAGQGYAVAQNNLGFMYANGRGVAPDKAQAAFWYEKAARQGNAAAQRNLAQIQQSVAPVHSGQPNMGTAAATQPGPPTSSSLPRRDGDYRELLDKAVADDSEGWNFNRYDRGSMRSISVLSRDPVKTIIRGSYTYNGGQAGWVEATLINDRLSCLRYWDISNTCRPPNDAERLRAQKQFAQDVERAGGLTFICKSLSGNPHDEVYTINTQNRTVEITQTGELSCTIIYKDGYYGPLFQKTPGSALCALAMGTDSVQQRVSVDGNQVRWSASSQTGSVTSTLNLKTGLLRISDGSMDECRQPHS